MYFFLCIKFWVGNLSLLWQDMMVLLCCVLPDKMVISPVFLAVEDMMMTMGTQYFLKKNL
jgi:hypothetical protein